MQEIDIVKIWVNEPRWSWFKTPLWKCNALRMEIKYLDMSPHTMNAPMWNVGASMSSRTMLVDKIEYHWIYFTAEEHVMFKLMNVEKNGKFDFMKLRKGIIYS